MGISEKPSKFLHSARESNPGPLGCESSVLPLHHRAPLLLGIDQYWFKSYLSKRTQSVRLNNHLSNKLEISYGTPQGSILGPILFTIYVNDLSEHINDCLTIQCADDTQFVRTDSIENIEDLIRRSDDTISKPKTYFVSY